MAIELKVPSAGESITEVTIAEWVKQEGAFARSDEIVAVIETDKANVDLVAPAAGKITKILKSAGEIAEVGEVIGYMEPGDGPKNGDAAPKAEPKPKVEAKVETKAEAPAEPQVKVAISSGEPIADTAPSPKARAAPSVRRAIRENGLDPSGLRGTGPAGRVTMEDVAAHRSAVAARETELVPMTRMRRRIAERLVTAQQTAALLTTFNEIDLGPVMALRKRYQEQFVQKYGIKLGFMSFFVKAAIEALKEFPAINAEIRDEGVVYHNYFDIGVAVGGGRGLVVPVIRNAERMSFAEIEQTIADFGRRARENKLTIEELQGGTFTISNGGVYGSLMSTPIVNPPQSGILGMHAIQDRPVVKDGQVVVGKMMYVALTYDHRIVDGREAVTFLVRIKECIEQPTRMLLEI